jgi:hypothetical protein
VRLNFSRTERRQIFANLLEYQSAGVLAQIRSHHAEKLGFDGKSQAMV